MLNPVIRPSFVASKQMGMLQGPVQFPAIRPESSKFRVNFRRKICQFVPVSLKCIRSMYGVIICQKWRQSIRKNPRVLPREKPVKRCFMKSSSHSSTVSKLCTYQVTAGKGIEAGDFSTFTFSHWANKIRLLIERHFKLKSEIKNVQIFELFQNFAYISDCLCSYTNLHPLCEIFHAAYQRNCF